MAARQHRRQAKDDLFDGFASIARALASGRRVELVELLSQGERTVEALAAEIDQSVANTSHHLRTLARAGLVSGQRRGTHVYYRLASDDVARLWWSMRRVAADRAADFDHLVEAYLGDRSGVEVIGADQLLERITRGDVLVVDVRPEAEFAAGHLPGAVNVPPDEFDRLVDLPDGPDVVAYCRGPYCVYADDAVRALKALGRRAVRLEDGLPEWANDGLPIRPVERERPAHPSGSPTEARDG